MIRNRKTSQSRWRTLSRGAAESVPIPHTFELRLVTYRNCARHYVLVRHLLVTALVRLRHIHAECLHLPPQNKARYAKQARRLLFVASGPRQSFPNQAASHLFDYIIKRRPRRKRHCPGIHRVVRDVPPKKVELELRAAGHNYGSLQNIPQFSYVTGPLVSA